MSDPRDERRKRERAEEQKRRDEMDAMLAEPKHPSFEAPATGKIAPDRPRRQTRVTQHVNASRKDVYGALVDAAAVARWMTPDGMTMTVHTFEPREGGALRITLTHVSPTAVGKTDAHTDTYHGHFTRLVPGAKVVQTLEFETADPRFQGEMTTSLTLADADVDDPDGGTNIVAIHEHLPPGLLSAENERGWRITLGKLARLVEGVGKP